MFGQVTNATVYQDEVDLVGVLKEADLGEIGLMEVEHETLGQIGVAKFPGRPVQAIEGELTWNYMVEAQMRRMSNPGVLQELYFHHHVDVFGEAGLSEEKSHTIVTLIKFFVISNSGMNPKLGEAQNPTSTISIHRFRQGVRGAETPIIDFDLATTLYQVDGKDVFPA